MGSSSYASPTAQNVQDWLGVNTDILAQSASGLAGRITDLMALAEAETKAHIGSANMESATLEAWQVLLLKEIVARRTAALFLEHPDVRKLTGTQEPNLDEDSSDYDDHIEALRERASELTDLVRNSIDAGSAPANDPQILTSFSSDDDHAFTRAMEF